MRFSLDISFFKTFYLRSPTHPNFKEEKYTQSRVTLRYDGPGEAFRDEVAVHQQPRGTYTLPVFKGHLSVGGCITVRSIKTKQFEHTTPRWELY